LIHETVLDTNVLVAALRSKQGDCHQLVRLIGQGRWRLNISVALALEYEEVLKRDAMLPGFSETEVDDFLDYLFGFQLDSLRAPPPSARFLGRVRSHV
jgi:predicted nucleic acid-binding protein